MMTKNDVLPLLSNCIFTGSLTEENYESKIIDNLPLDFPFTMENGISRLVIIPENARFVIKIPFTGNERGSYSYDYCLQEILTYQKAKTAKVNYFFLKLTLVGFVQNYPIYIQPKAQTYLSLCGNDCDTFSSDSFPTTEYLPNDWLEQANLCYGHTIVHRFLNFFMKYKIYSDMHIANFGFFRNYPVLIDYAGFMDKQ